MENSILFGSLVTFVIGMVLHISLNKKLKEKKPLKSLLELVIGISLVVSLTYLLL